MFIKQLFDNNFLITDCSDDLNYVQISLNSFLALIKELVQSFGFLMRPITFTAEALADKKFDHITEMNLNLLIGFTNVCVLTIELSESTLLCIFLGDDLTCIQVSSFISNWLEQSFIF